MITDPGCDLDPDLIWVKVCHRALVHQQVLKETIPHEMMLTEGLGGVDHHKVLEYSSPECSTALTVLTLTGCSL